MLLFWSICRAFRREELRDAGRVSDSGLQGHRTHQRSEIHRTPQVRRSKQSFTSTFTTSRTYFISSCISWESNLWFCRSKHLLESYRKSEHSFLGELKLYSRRVIVLLSVILGFVRTGFSWTLFRDKRICRDSQPTVCLSQSQHASVLSDESHGWNKSFISPVKPAAVCQSPMCSRGFDLICSEFSAVVRKNTIKKKYIKMPGSKDSFSA